VSAFVVSEVTFGREQSFTVAAFVRLFARMNPLMSLEISFFAEGLIANFALIWLLSCMLPQMIPQL
jgi:hypothetical protein